MISIVQDMHLYSYLDMLSLFLFLVLVLLHDDLLGFRSLPDMISIIQDVHLYSYLDSPGIILSFVVQSVLGWIA